MDETGSGTVCGDDVGGTGENYCDGRCYDCDFLEQCDDYCDGLDDYCDDL